MRDRAWRRFKESTIVIRRLKKHFRPSYWRSKYSTRWIDDIGTQDHFTYKNTSTRYTYPNSEYYFKYKRVNYKYDFICILKDYEEELRKIYY